MTGQPPPVGPSAASELLAAAGLLAALERFAARSDGGAPLLVASDFDGVLAPLVDDPAASRPTDEASEALNRLAGVGHGRLRVALVSGRTLDALAGLSQAPSGTMLVGSHGAERGEVTDDGVARTPFTLTPAQAELLARVTAGLEVIAEPIRGAWVEHKPSAAVLHSRLAEPGVASGAIAAAVALGDELGAHTMVGKDVVEMAVVETSKGRALEELRDELDAVAVFYMGDDVTDERAFAVLRDGDLSVKVGPGETIAAFRVDDPAAAARVLTALADLVS